MGEADTGGYMEYDVVVKCTIVPGEQNLEGLSGSMTATMHHHEVERWTTRNSLLGQRVDFLTQEEAEQQECICTKTRAPQIAVANGTCSHEWLPTNNDEMILEPLHRDDGTPVYAGRRVMEELVRRQLKDHPSRREDGYRMLGAAPQRKSSPSSGPEEEGAKY
jgi:hypothetical protein